MNKTRAENCASKGTLIRALMGELGEREREKFRDHMIDCPQCRLQFDVLVQVQSELRARENAIPEIALDAPDEKQMRAFAREQVEAAARKARPAFSRTLRLGAALAGALVLLVLGYHLSQRPSRIEQNVRGSSRPELRLHSPEGKIKAAPSLFSWSEVQGRDSFSFSLIDDELNTVFTKTLGQTQLRLPDEVRQKLEKGKSYLWTVEARDDDNKPLASGSLYFEIE